MKPSEKLFLKYEYLAKKYANRIYSYEQLSYEYEDLVQEFKLKIFTAIKSYGRRYYKYRNGMESKPVGIKYYLEAACGNKMRDFIKYIDRENYKIRIDDIDYDFGVEDTTFIEPEKNTFIVNGVDLLEGLVGKDRAVFSLYLRGHNKSTINKVYYADDVEDDEPLKAEDVIRMQREFLIKKYGNDLQQANQVYSSYNLDED